MPISFIPWKNAQECIFSLKQIQPYTGSCCSNHFQNSALFWEKWECREDAERLYQVKAVETGLTVEWPHDIPWSFEECWALGPSVLGRGGLGSN